MVDKKEYCLAITSKAENSEDMIGGIKELKKRLIKSNEEEQQLLTLMTEYLAGGEEIIQQAQKAGQKIREDAVRSLEVQQRHLFELQQMRDDVYKKLDSIKMALQQVADFNNIDFYNFKEEG